MQTRRPNSARARCESARAPGVLGVRTPRVVGSPGSREKRLHGIAGRLVLLLALAAPATVRAELRIHWDCYLPAGNVDCTVLETSLVSKIPFLTVVSNPAEADVLVTLTSGPAEDSARFKIDFVGKAVEGFRTEVHTTDKIPSIVDATTADVRLMTKLERGLDDFMDQKIAGEVHDGRLNLELLDPVALPFSGRPEQSAVKFYVSPSISSYLSDVAGVGVNAWANGSVAFNLSEDACRYQSWLGVNYNRQSQPVPGTNETASVGFLGANTNNVFAWSFGEKRWWSVGLLLAAEKNPQANYSFRANGSVGVEFDLIPRQTVNQRNFGFRCAVGPEYQRYDATNIQRIGQQIVGREFCDLFFSWHFAAVDLGANLGETAILEDWSFNSITVGLSATFRITDSLSVSVWANLQEINKAINEAEPSTSSYSTPQEEIEASLLAAAQQGYTAPLGVQGGLSIKYVFGNGSLALEDQRWRNTSNLR